MEPTNSYLLSQLEKELIEWWEQEPESETPIELNPLDDGSEISLVSVKDNSVDGDNEPRSD